MWSSRKAAWGIRILERYKNCRDGKAKALFWRKETSSVQLKLRGIAGHKLHIYILKVSRQVPQATIVVVQLLSRVQLFVTSWTAARQASLSFISWSLLKLLSVELMMPSNHLILCHSLLLLPSIFPSIRIFSSESVLCIRWPKYWSFSFSISPCNEYSGLISFRIDWFDLLAVQGTLKSLLQHHSSKASG